MTTLLLILAMGGCLIQGNTRDAQRSAQLICDENPRAIKVVVKESANLDVDIVVTIPEDRVSIHKGTTEEQEIETCNNLRKIMPHVVKINWMMKTLKGKKVISSRCERRNK